MLVYKKDRYIGYVDRYGTYIPETEKPIFPFEAKAYHLEYLLTLVLYSVRLFGAIGGAVVLILMLRERSAKRLQMN